MAETFHPQKGPYIRDLQPGQHFIGFYFLRNKQLEPFRDPSRGFFLTLILGDRSGQMLGRVWEGAESVDETLERGQVVKIEGEVETYLDRTQIRVLRMRQAGPDEYDLRDFTGSSERDLEAMLTDLQSYRERIANSYLRGLVDYFYTDEEFLKRFQKAPAAQRVHHAYLGGLLEHTIDMLTLCQTVLQVYPQVDADLLYSGVLLHHIGKTREYSWDMDIDYTDEGRLLGDVVLTYEMVSDALQMMPGFPKELALRLRHMLVSHHGRTEWGSPRRPQTLEAIALHYLEDTTTQINRFQGLIENRPPGEAWTSFDRLLRRQLYAGPEDEDLGAEEPGWSE